MSTYGTEVYGQEVYDGGPQAAPPVPPTAALRITQAGVNVLIGGSSPVRITQAGANLLLQAPSTSITATADIQAGTYGIRLDYRGAVGCTDHRLYRKQSPWTTPPGPTDTPIATFGSLTTGSDRPTFTRFEEVENPLWWGTRYYYAFSAVIGGVFFTDYDDAITEFYTAPTFGIGAITTDSAKVAVFIVESYVTLEYETTEVGVGIIDSGVQSGPRRFDRDLTGLTPDTDYSTRVRGTISNGVTAWSDPLAWSTFLTLPTEEFACPPAWSGIVTNPDGNPWISRDGEGFYHPLPGEPLRGASERIVFRWRTSRQWSFYLSDDAGATYPTLVASGVGGGDIDADRLIKHTFTLDVSGLADGTDYRLKAVTTDGGSAESVESMTFPVDNAEEVKWWRGPYLTADESRFGQMWAELQQTNPAEPIWKRARGGEIAAVRGHDPALLADLTVEESYGADATVRWLVWSGEGGYYRTQAGHDTELAAVGIGFFAQGLTTAERQGVVAAVDVNTAWILGCCNDYLTDSTAYLYGAVGETPGSALTEFARAVPRVITKLFIKAVVQPIQTILDCILNPISGLPWYHAPPSGRSGFCSKPWNMLAYRKGLALDSGFSFVSNTCARRWEVYSQRTRAEVDPVDPKKVRVRTRLDGPGIEDPAAGYWHFDETHTFAADVEPGATGFFSQQFAPFAVALFGYPEGARVFLSSSILPLNPTGYLPAVPPLALEPFYEPLQGQPCTVNLMVFEEDRETVRFEVGTDSAHPLSYLVEPSSYGEQEIDPVEGAATIGQVEVTVIDRRQAEGDQDSGFLTENLGVNSIGAIHGYRCRLLRFISDELGWVVIADGPAGTPRLDESYSAYRWDIRDTRETERKVKAFVRADTSWLLPMGVEGGFGSYVDEDGDAQWLVSPAEPLVGEYSYDDTKAYPTGGVSFEGYWPGGFGPFGGPIGTQVVPESIVLNEATKEQFVARTEELGDPLPVRWTWPQLEILWRIAGSGDAWTVVNPSDTLVQGRTVAKRPGASYWNRRIVARADAELADGTAVEAATGFVLRGYLAEGTFPNDGDTIEVAIRYVGPPTEDIPLHIEGITPGELLTKGYDGEYSYPDPVTGAYVPTGIRYDPDAMEEVGSAISASSLLLAGAGRLSLSGLSGSLALSGETTATPQITVRFRVTEPVDDFRSWAEEYVYAPTGWIPALDNDGRISPKSQIPPGVNELASLVQIDNAITEPSPDWDAGERIINILDYQYPRWYVGAFGDTNAVDGLLKRDISIQYRDEASITRHAEQTKDYPGEVFSAVGDPEGQSFLLFSDEQGYILATLRRSYVFDRYRNGTPTIQVPVRRDFVATTRAGDFVICDHSWFPDYVTERRGLLMLGQVLAINDVDCEWRILLIEQVQPIVEES